MPIAISNVVMVASVTPIPPGTLRFEAEVAERLGNLIRRRPSPG